MSTPSPAARILIVEDDPSIQLGLRMNLESEGYQTSIAEDGAIAMTLLREEHWDLIILDVMLPKLNGYEVLTRMRSEGIHTPVLVLSARTGENDKVMGLDLGAEDYISKPFSVPELLARVRAALRRRANHNTDNNSNNDLSWNFGSVSVDPRTREVRLEGEPVELTVTEFNILLALARAAGRSLTREQIFEAVWGPEHHGTHRTIDNFVGQLRHKLEPDPASPQHLLTVRGVGYRLAL